MMIWSKKTHTLIFLCLIFVYESSLLVAKCEREERGYEEEEEGGGSGGGGSERRNVFLLRESKKVIETEGGEVRVFRGFVGSGMRGPIHIGFINMEPNILFVPQYVDVNLILFVRRGEVKIGWIHKDQMVEKHLKIGDIYRITAGSPFYMVNTGKGQRLQIICSIDTSESLGTNTFQSFFIGGGKYPSSILSGFDSRTLTTAFNVSMEELRTLTEGQRGGAIIYTKEAGKSPLTKASLMQLKKQAEKFRFNRRDEDEKEEDIEKKEEGRWTWRKLMYSFLGFDENSPSRITKAPDSYNLYERKPDFSNKYGWSIALDGHDYSPLRDSGVGVYLVNLTAGAMLAPHVNPRATEYGIILRGSGTIQIVYPNGSTAMNTDVEEGDVFWVPRYFPFCQVAAGGGALEFFGFTTSSGHNHPQFLAGARSALRSMNGPELAAAFGVTPKRFEHLVNSQTESVILAPWPLAPEKKEEKREERRGERNS